MSAITDRLSDEDLRELARLTRVIVTDAEAWREQQENEHSQGGGDAD